MTRLQRLSEDDIQCWHVELLAFNDVPQRQALPRLLHVRSKQHIWTATAAHAWRLRRRGQLPVPDGGRCASAMSRPGSRGRQDQRIAAGLKAAAARTADLSKLHDAPC